MKRKLIVSFVLALILVSACAPAAAPGSEGIDVPTPATSNIVPTQPPAPTAIPPTPAPTVIASMTVNLNAANSGSVCPNRSPEVELGSAPPYIGELDDEYVCIGYWSFDLTALPSQVTILAATFSPGACSRIGDPFSLSALYFKRAAAGQIDAADFGNQLVDATTYTACLENIDVASAVRSGYKTGYVQFVASFDMTDYGNGTGDYISYSGSQPTLTIEYSYTP